MHLTQTLKTCSKLWRAAALLLCTAGALATQSGKSQIIYSNNFNNDDSANWAVNYSDVNGPANSAINFDFDYTTAGLPIAPHSAEFGSTTVHHGLKMTPDYATGGGLIGTAAVPGVSASPTNFSITSDFVMHADMWVNVNCTAYTSPGLATSAHNGSSSSVLYGCGYGTAGTEAVVAGQSDGIFVATCTDNGSSAQMRMYGPNQTGSYQSGVYQSTGTTTPGFPGDPFVYDQSAGSRTFYNDAYWSTVFPSNAVPLAQQILQPHQTNNYSLPGLIDFKWHDVEVDKIGSVIVYKIDGKIVATGNESSAGTVAGPYLIYSAGDINSGASTDPNYTNVNFVVFANIVVSNYANVVSIAAPTAVTSEATPNLAGAGVVTISRSSAGVPLTVNYTLSGTATNGIQYSIVGGTTTNVTLSSTALSTNIYIVPIDDGIPNPTTTVIVNLQSGTNYAGAGSAVVSILDNDPTTIDISGGSQAYGRYTVAASTPGYNDYMTTVLTRRGKLTIGSDLSVNVTYSGSAVPGTDFTPVSSITIPDGVSVVTNELAPLDNASVTTNRTAIISVASGSNYAIGNGPATNVIVTAHYPAPLAVLLNDPLTSASDSGNWNITYGCGDPQDDATDYEVNFGQSLASAPGGISVPPPPGGNSTALHLTVNKDVVPGSAGAVNVYYNTLALSNNYAVRFNMNLIQGQLTANNTEGAVFGINHTGSLSNWWYGGGFLTNATWSSDGVWFYVTAQAGGSVSGDYEAFTGLGGTNGNTGFQILGTQSAGSFAQAFKDTTGQTGGGPFTSLNGFGDFTSGVPAEGSPVLGYDASTWSDVEIKQQDGVVTLSINHSPILAYTNTTVWTNGYLMLGYEDPYGASIGSPEAGVYYANLQVVQIPSAIQPVVSISSIAITGGNVVITFTTTSSADTTSSFTLQSSGNIKGTFSGVSPAATITSLGGNTFQATTPYTGGTQFYNILDSN